MKSFLKRGFLLLLVAWPSLSLGAPLNVFFVTGGDSGIPGTILAGIRKGIESRAQAIVHETGFDGVYRPGEIVVSVGVEGAKSAASLDPRIPILSIFVPRKAFDEIGRSREKYSAIYIDQPLRRQLNLIRLAFPEKHRIGILLGPDSKAQLPALQAAAADEGFELSLASVSSQQELFSSLEKVLKESDILLAVPDPLVFNTGTISGILLTAYRYNIPLAGFSASYVRAGALIALYSTVEQISWQAAEAISGFSSKGVLPPPGYPAYFTVGVNGYVARSMEIEIHDEATFEEKLGHMEDQP